MDTSPTTWRCDVAGVSFELTCDRPSDSGAVRSLLRRHLAAIASPGGTATLQLMAQDSAPSPPAELEPVHSADHIHVWRTPEGFWLETGGSSATVHPDQGVAYLNLGPGFAALPGNSQRDLVLTPMVMLMRHRDTYVLHASGAERDGCGVLALGRSGSGKTTSVLSLISGGWRFLGDDMVALRVDGTHCTAHAFRRSMSAGHTELARFGFTDPPYPDDAGGTPPFDTEGNPERTVDAFPPSLLLFPTITDDTTTELMPLNPAETLADLGSAMGGIMTDPVWAKRQLDAAAVLAQQAPGFRVLLGRDAYEDPGLLSRLLQEEGLT